MAGNKRGKINEDTPLIPISTAADLLGLHTRTLMLYEYEKLIIPRRNPSNRRMYSQQDIKKIRFIQYLTQKKRINLAGIRTIFQMLKKAEEAGIDLKSLAFSSYTEE